MLIYQVQGSRLFKTSQPPHETTYDREALEREISDLMKKYGLVRLYAEDRKGSK